MKQGLKLLVLAGLTAGVTMGGYVSSLAADAAGRQVYTLNPVVVTATRTEKEDLEVPATTTVISAQELKDKGYTSAFEAINNVVGVDSYNYGAGGGDDYGGSISRFYIRGMDKGTLVLVNGAPVNIMNYSSTEGVPIGAIEKIEVIKGSNSTLYGAEAMGGVVNIITKHGGETGGSVTAKVGNYQSGYEVNLQDPRYTFWLSRDYTDNFDHAGKIFPGSSYNWDNKKANKTSFYLATNINDRLSLDWSHVDSSKDRDAMAVRNGRRTGRYYSMGKYSYDSQRNNVNLIYNDKDHEFKSVLAYNNRRLDTKHYSYRNGSLQAPVRSTNYNVYGIVFDNQKTWRLDDGRDSLTGGVTFRREHYKSLETPSDRLLRDNYSLYASYDRHFNDRLSTIIGMRGEFYKSNGWDDEQKVFLPQWQMLYKMNKNWSLYTNIGRSFDMPAINSKFYSPGHTAPTHYNPQKGWSYEIGTKYVNDKDSLKIDVFHMDVDDYFRWLRRPDRTYYQVNAGKFRNTGIEAEWTHEVNSHWQYNLGVSVSDPENKNPHLTHHQNEWMQAAAKVQTNAGVLYHDEKWRASLNLYYTGEREYSGYNRHGTYINSSGAWDHKIPSKINLTSSIAYAPNKHNEIALNLYNILDRDNPINNSENWDLPYNWTLTYKYSF